MAAIAIFESGLRRPNQLLAIGAKAMIGIALMAMASGRTVSREVGKRDTMNAVATPSTVPRMRPPMASNRVTRAAGRMA